MGYRCPLCKKKFTAFEAITCVDPSDGLFYCDICKSELVQDKGSDALFGKHEQYTK